MYNFNKMDKTLRNIEITSESLFKIPKIELKFSSNLSCEYINVEENDKLLSFKNKIDHIKSQKVWDKSKKLTNDYELIHLPNKKLKSDSIALYEPLSRSYFKLWELIFDFNILEKNSNDDMIIAGLAEGPGGFVEAILNFRKKYCCKNDQIYAITLKSTNKDVPGWKKATSFIKKHENIKISYGANETGNIYDLENILHFKSISANADIVTADGGFDFSIDFNKQEQLSYRLIFCEIVLAFSVQKKGGTFICKFFDIYTTMTINFIYLIKCFYKNVYLTKPLTSRPANSEKYIVAKGFKGISNEYLQELYMVVLNWNIIDENNMFMNNIFNIELPADLLKDISNYNTNNCNMQVENIKKTFNIINKNLNSKEMGESYKNQITKAINWCKKYEIKINNQSTFVNQVLV
jgi:23S rRNA U2552 (ribose-2'-O)-methylase RlmE/FtsJ